MTDRPTPLLVLDVVGLTPRLLPHMPNLRRIAESGFQARLDTVLPAVTCTVQSTLLTGAMPDEHGIVGNGWYFRDLGEVLLWRQHNALVSGEKVWQTARTRHPGYRVANICWWYAMGADVDYTITPRPVYHADGRKDPDCYTHPPHLHDTLTHELGPFPLFQYWGPTASITSSAWITEATRRLMLRERPDLTLAYLPHLDYDLQRHGPDHPTATHAATELDTVLGPLLDDARRTGTTVLALSEYGITNARRPIDINRALRRAGLLHVHTQQGMEYLDPWTSRAFAVADHQIAHIYIRDPHDHPRVRAALAELDGIAHLLDDTGKTTHHLGHERAGDLIALAEPDAWFTYYYWLDDTHAPDYARLVEIHRKPGYDPAELFMNPTDPYVRLRAATALLRKRLGLRYTMNVVPLDPSPVRGTHGLLPTHPDDGPVLLCTDPTPTRDHYHATEIKELMLTLAGL
ncbi:alkaline phosphatase family protein [Allostreptomyces psammosilenae]|uniref:Putative AlkP superfamily pyrophosphatase or phosphodiesterase n=1 Tax=Allostreptomyces psammosilenae TaxID=1892865 RepID=A0A852ZN81_9ACTN|nr:nucleotide pyrophosphatase/phosphodiesterase family protein [Allostreptomyces psammosilenae]NYI03859.1 putative AlkP superfamily pyrophosphatase or phosphodiesterase [Allostreptomyces psammosilenae]